MAMKEAASTFLLAFALLTFASTLASAFDPAPLQDFCVAVNDIKDGDGMCSVCEWEVLHGSKMVEANDFLFQGLNILGNTNNPVGSNVTLIDVTKLPGLNTRWIALARVDYAPNGGLSPPHIHPRATEIQVLLEATLYVGFVSSNQNGNRFFTKVLYPGDVFVFPVGMIHFQFNIGNTPDVAISGLSSQFPGVVTIANTVFGAKPSINPGVLSKGFMLDKNVVQLVQSKF